MLRLLHANSDQPKGQRDHGGAGRKMLSQDLTVNVLFYLNRHSETELARGNRGLLHAPCVAKPRDAILTRFFIFCDTHPS